MRDRHHLPMVGEILPDDSHTGDTLPRQSAQVICLSGDCGGRPLGGIRPPVPKGGTGTEGP